MPKSLIQISEMLQKRYRFQNATCAQNVSLLQNSEMFQNTTCAQSVYLLQNSEKLDNEIQNCTRLKLKDMNR